MGAVDQDALVVVSLRANGTVVAGSVKVVGNNMGGMPASSIAGGSHFGWSIATCGDIDRDGVADLTVGARTDGTGGPDTGAAYILYLNPGNDADPVKDFLKLSNLTSGVGAAFSSGGLWAAAGGLGDLDGDRRPDLLLAGRGDSTAGVGRGSLVVAFMGGALASPSPSVSPTPSASPSPSPARAGDVIRSVKIADGTGGFPGNLLGNNDLFGESVRAIGDIDGDGIVDVAAWAIGDADGATLAGATWIVFLNRDGTAKNVSKISATEGGAEFSASNEGYFGASPTRFD